MIVVKIEMWPKGDESKKYEIGRTFIYNAGGTLTRANYEVRVCRKGGLNKAPSVSDLHSGEGFARTGRVEGYPRLSYNVWRLILRALRSCFPEEK
jgi:hypothetical protein